MTVYDMIVKIQVTKIVRDCIVSTIVQSTNYRSVLKKIICSNYQTDNKIIVQTTNCRQLSDK